MLFYWIDIWLPLTATLFIFNAVDEIKNGRIYEVAVFGVVVCLLINAN